MKKVKKFELIGTCLTCCKTVIALSDEKPDSCQDFLVARHKDCERPSFNGGVSCKEVEKVFTTRKDRVYSLNGIK